MWKILKSQSTAPWNFWPLHTIGCAPLMLLRMPPPGSRPPISVRATLPACMPKIGPQRKWRASSEIDGVPGMPSPYAVHGCRAELAISSMCMRASWISSLLSLISIFAASTLASGTLRWPRVCEKTAWFAVGIRFGQIGT